MGRKSSGVGWEEILSLIGGFIKRKEVDEEGMLAWMLETRSWGCGGCEKSLGMLSKERLFALLILRGWLG